MKLFNKISIAAMLIAGISVTAFGDGEWFAMCSSHINSISDDCHHGAVGAGCLYGDGVEPCHSYVTDTSHCVNSDPVPWHCTDAKCKYPPVTINTDFCRTDAEGDMWSGWFLVCNCEP